ncbi:phosphocarrier protein [Arthrobacter sp. cf158]|uniref:HPr family phosphocarrier protein n=1 Tax=Arthrobacter sp. cf158 TaxID=1761744 RepID=UPI000897A984|nr:HPr family phosphocarrier protein [Arthrobacter sp. cf158]SDW51026.1 phosphocarrier protein [Arthrobacter sp. cf158]
MPEQRAVVGAEIGLHARAAAVFVRAVTDTGLPVTIRKKDGRPVDARSLLEVMTEDFGHGCEVFLGVAPEALRDDQTAAGVKSALNALSAVLEATEAR